MNLEILICTFNERLRSVPEVFSPPRPDVVYLVAFQYTDDKYLELAADHRLKRSDVRICTVKGRGLAANRNMALENAVGDVLLIADDDVRYKKESFDSIIRHFQSDPSLDIACFQASDEKGVPLRHYPDFSFTYDKRPRGTYFRSVELALRRHSPLPSFDERFGLGAPYLSCGEEEVFLHQASLRHLQITYFPEQIVSTKGSTTGTRFFESPSVQRAKGAVLCIMHGATGAWLRCLKFTVCRCLGRHPLRIFREMVHGIKYVK